MTVVEPDLPFFWPSLVRYHFIHWPDRHLGTYEQVEEYYDGSRKLYF